MTGILLPSSFSLLTALLAAIAPELSTIAVPIELSLAPLVPQIEKQVPKSFASKTNEHGVEITYDIVRDPIKLNMIGRGLHADTIARYAVRACPGRLPCISCGIDEPRRQATISLQSTFTWDAQWRLRSTTRAVPASFPNRCTVTRLDIDVTDRVIAPRVNDQLRDIAASVDRNVPAMTNIAPIAKQVWSALQTPVEVAPRTWLIFEPSDVALGPLQGSGLRVTTTLMVTAKTQILVADRATWTAKPLPALKNAAAPPGALSIPFDVRLSYEDASKLMTAQFGNRTYGKTRIGAIRLRAASASRVAVETTIDYNGGGVRKYSGPITLEGTPRFDPATGTISVPDLDYSLESRQRSLFFRIAEHVTHDDIRNRIRDAAKWNVAKDLGDVRQEITRAINRPLAEGVMLRGRVDAVVPREVFATPEGLVVRAAVTGAASVQVTAMRP